MVINNILIVNQPLTNRGDEAAHRAFIHGLRRKFPEAKIVVLAFADHNNWISDFIVDDPMVTYDRFIFRHSYKMESLVELSVKKGCAGLITSLHPNLRHLRKYYKTADVVMCAPGGICMGGFQSWDHLYFLILAEFYGKPVVYYSRSIGPFPDKTKDNRRFRSISFDLLHKFKFLSLRDKISEKYAEQIDVPFVSSIDTAFLDQPRVEIPHEISCKLKENYVVFVPNQLTWHFAFRNVKQHVIDNFYLTIMKILRDNFPDSQIVMLPQLCSLGENGDRPYFTRLAAQQCDDNIFVLPDTYSSDVQQTIISSSKMVIGARYHSVVFSINNEVPFLALNYESKIKGLLECLNLSENMIDITSAFVDDDAKAKVENEIKNKVEILKHKKPQRAEALRIATHCMDELSNKLTKI